MLVVTTDEIRGWDVQRVCGEVFGVALRARPAPGAEGEAALTESRNDVLTKMLEHARVEGRQRRGRPALREQQPRGRIDRAVRVRHRCRRLPVDEGAKQTATALGYGQPSADPAAAQQQPRSSNPPSRATASSSTRNRATRSRATGYGQQQRLPGLRPAAVPGPAAVPAAAGLPAVPAAGLPPAVAHRLGCTIPPSPWSPAVSRARVPHREGLDGRGAGARRGQVARADPASCRELSDLRSVRSTAT